MGEITILLLFAAAAGTAGLGRVVRRREQRAATTREWIEFLQEDLAASAL
jgi:hypothetical protein